MTRLLLVRHAATAATERGAFGADEPLSDSGCAAAAALRAQLPAVEAVVSSPALRCRQTAAALGLSPSLEPELSECRFGNWEGRTFAEVSRQAPGLVDGWLRDPDAAPHGGESLTRFAARAAGWLDGASRSATDRLAVTHAGVIRAVVVSALRAPLEAFWRINVAPLSITELHAHEGSWTLGRMNWTAVL